MAKIKSMWICFFRSKIVRVLTKAISRSNARSLRLYVNHLHFIGISRRSESLNQLNVTVECLLLDRFSSVRTRFNFIYSRFDK